MHISAKAEYACLALLELALRYEESEPVRIRTLAQAHEIPSRFLVQILLQLKGAGLVASTRGAAGGYRLLKDPREITLADVLHVIEGPLQGAGEVQPANPVARALHDAWRRLTAAEEQFLRSQTLAQLAERARRGNDPMYYI